MNPFSPESLISLYSRAKIAGANLWGRDPLRGLTSEPVPDLVINALRALEIQGTAGEQSRAHAQLVVTAPDWMTGARRTRFVIEEMISGAVAEIIISGFQVSDPDFIRRLADRTAQGVRVDLFVDADQTSVCDLKRLWPPGSGEIIVWHEANPSGVNYSSLHAKVILIDGRSALVTSANLTRSGLDSNIEIGLRVEGDIVSDIRKFVRLIIERGMVREAARIKG